MGKNAHAHTSPSVRLGDRSIGPDHPVYVIAEAGVNHNGDLDSALELVHAAADTGADAIKFQVFEPDNLVADTAPLADYQKPSTNGSGQRDMLRQLKLPADAFATIKQLCDRLGVTFLATPFGVQELHALLELQPVAIKIASTDIVNVPLLRAAIRSGLPVIASTGAARLDEIDDAVAMFSQANAAGRLILMHCVSSYPTPTTRANLRVISMYTQRYDCPIGFSDHTESLSSGAVAVGTGACMLEKHFTIDRTQSGPDHSFSLEPVQLQHYISAARQAWQMLGNADKRISPAEKEIRLVSRGSLHAAVDIPAGTTITDAMLLVSRPSGGISPRHVDDVTGQRTSVPIPKGTRLQWDMFSRAERSTDNDARYTEDIAAAFPENTT